MEGGFNCPKLRRSKAPLFDLEEMQSPPASPAMIFCRLAKEKQVAGASQWNVVSATPLSGSHTFTVLSPDAETARFPSAVTATPLT